MQLLASIMIAGLVSLATATLAEAAPGPASQVAAYPETVRKLIAELAADDWRQREAAEKDLTAMGEAVIENLRVATRSENAEIRQRAEVILFKLTDPVSGYTPRVTLKFEDAPAREVYQSLFKQIDAPLKTWPADLWDQPGGRKVTIDLQKATFWEAFDALEEQTGLTLRAIGSETVLHAAEPRGRGPAPAVFRHGAFRVVLDGRAMRRLTVFVEPRLRVLAYAPDADVEKLVEARPGHPHGIRHPDIVRPDLRQHLHGRGGNVFDVSLPHWVAPHDLVYVKGSVRARMARRERQFEIGGIDKANDGGVVDQLINGQRALMNLSSPEPGEFKVMLSIAHSNPPPADLEKDGLRHARPTLLDAAGNALSTPGGATYSSPQRVHFTCQFKATPNFGKPAKIVLSIPDRISEIAIPFEFGQPPEAGNGAKQ